MTLVVLLGNALPAAQRKHRLQHEERLLQRERRSQSARYARLAAEHGALRADPFYLERLYSETWATTPHGAIEFAEVGEPQLDFEE